MTKKMSRNDAIHRITLLSAAFTYGPHWTEQEQRLEHLKTQSALHALGVTDDELHFLHAYVR